MIFPRKENRPAKRDRTASPPKPRPVASVRRRGRARPDDAGAKGEILSPSPGGGKAPFRSRALALSLLILPLFSLLIFSFQSLSSPALAAGEEAPTFRWPAEGEVVVGFRQPIGHYGEGGHSGIDIALPVGSEVRAAATGLVNYAGRTPLGTCVSIIHAGDFKTTYVSLQSASVRKGDKVEAGQIIGRSDGTHDRSSPAPHLHFGLFLRGVAVDPLPFLEGVLLDPRQSLFLGPWEDTHSVRTYLERHGGGGFLDWMGRRLRSAGNVVVKAGKSALDVPGRVLGVLWKWTCDAACVVGRAGVSFYRACMEPWLSPLWRTTARAVRAILSNRFMQAVLACLAAATVICLAVVGIGFVLGFSLAAIIAAAVVGGAGAVGYAVYYTFTSGDSFSFLGCFLGSLAVGGIAAGGCLLFSYLAPTIGAGWANLGWLGFGKGFLAHGFADLVVYTGFCLVTRKNITPGGLLASFLIGGLAGGLGKLVVNGIFSSGMVQGLAAGFLSSGGSILGGGGLTYAAVYASAYVSQLSQKLAYMFLCGCAGFLGDVVLRAATGGRPSLLEACLSFGGGFLAGGVSLLAEGQGIGGLLSRMSGGRLKVSGEFTKALTSKSFSKGMKEGAKALLGRMRGKRRTEESLRWLNAGGEPMVR